MSVEQEAQSDGLAEVPSPISKTDDFIQSARRHISLDQAFLCLEKDGVLQRLPKDAPGSFCLFVVRSISTYIVLPTFCVVRDTFDWWLRKQRPGLKFFDSHDQQGLDNTLGSRHRQISIESTDSLGSW